jgi:hypothetical protein
MYHNVSRHFRELAENKSEHISIYHRHIHKMADDLHVSVLFIYHPVCPIWASDTECRKVTSSGICSRPGTFGMLIDCWHCVRQWVIVNACMRVIMPACICVHACVPACMRVCVCAWVCEHRYLNYQYLLSIFLRHCIIYDANEPIIEESRFSATSSIM